MFILECKKPTSLDTVWDLLAASECPRSAFQLQAPFWLGLAWSIEHHVFQPYFSDQMHRGLSRFVVVVSGYNPRVFVV
jgi:hypothetical protein